MLDEFGEYLTWCIEVAERDLARIEAAHIEGAVLENVKGELFALRRVRNRFTIDFPTHIDVPAPRIDVHSN